MVFVAVLLLHHAFHVVVHFLIFCFAHTELIDSAVRTAVKGMHKILADQPRGKGVICFFASEAVHFTQLPVKSNRSVIKFSSGKPFNNSAKSSARSGKHNVDISICIHL
ncbi:hypothetical protein D3C74_302850 [compost metagenome]